MKESMHQQEADRTVEATLRAMDKIEEVLEDCGLPLRVDNYGGADVLTFDDKTTLKVE